MKESIKINYLYNIAYQLMLIIVPLITAPYISRVLGPEKIGQQSYYYSIATYFLLFIMLGVMNYGNRSIAKVRDETRERSKKFWSIYSFQFIRGIVVLLLYYIYIYNFEDRNFLLAAINGIYVLSGVLDINWLFFGLEKFKITVTRNFILKIINVISIFVFVKSADDIWKYALIVSLFAFLSNAYLWIYLGKFVQWYKPNITDMYKHIKPEIVLFVPIIAISLYKVMDRILLSIFSNDIELGYFTQAESVISIPLSLITALGTVMLPRISNLASTGEIETIKKYIETSILIAMMLAFAMAFGLAAIASVFSITFFGPQYEACGSLIIGLAVTIVFISWANVIRTQYLIPYEKDKIYILSVIMGAVLNLVCNFYLIPKFAAIGAVISTIIAEGAVCVIQTYFVREILPIKKYIKETIPFFVMGVIMLVVIKGCELMISDIELRLVFNISIGILVFSLLFIIYCRIIKNDITKYANKIIIGKILKA